MTYTVFQGSLFSNDFVQESISRVPDWASLDDAGLEAFRADLRGIFDRFPTAQTPNESQTEDDLIWPILTRLGWTASLRQQNLAARGRDDVPDGLLFQDDPTKARANAFPEEWKRYEFGLAIVESKRWNRPLDRQSGRHGEETAPSTQMLRYLRRVEDLTTGKLRWGMLTNGARWRLYYQGARSVSEQFFDGPKIQSERFIEAARKLGCDEDPAHFDEILKKVVRHKPPSEAPCEPKEPKTKKPG